MNQRALSFEAESLCRLQPLYLNMLAGAEFVLHLHQIRTMDKGRELSCWLFLEMQMLLRHERVLMCLCAAALNGLGHLSTVSIILALASIL